MVDVIRPDRLRLAEGSLEPGIFVYEPISDILSDKVGILQHCTEKKMAFWKKGEEGFVSLEVNSNTLCGGDVLASDGRGNLRVLLSKIANQNTLLLTDECENRCTFCSQPPKPSGHYFQDALLALQSYEGEGVIGLTGGEPTLFWDDFINFVKSITELKRFNFHLLSHGRNFADAEKVNVLNESDFTKKTLFGVPFHGPNDLFHDQVTGSIGSFDQTMRGVQNLAFTGAALELRIILTQQIAPVLVDTVEMLWSHFRWVRPTIAIMQLEPVGWANKHYESLYVDPLKIQPAWDQLCDLIGRTSCRVALYNFPRCQLPQSLRKQAHQSISDWKNYYADECFRCIEKPNCCGFFSSSTGRAAPLVSPISGI